MKKIILTTVLLSSILLSDSSSRYGVTKSLHTEDSKVQMQESLSNNIKKKEKVRKKIKEIVSFMENYKVLSKQQREEAKQFQIYVNTHIESIASCKNLEDDFKLDMKKGISNDEEMLYEEEIEECKDDLSSNTVSYESAETFFNEALETLNKLKTKNKIAGKRYKILQTSLEEVNALVDYLKTSNK